MRLSQEQIRRMIEGRGGSGGGGGGSLDPSALAGMASQAWVEEGYISKAFWNELFIIHKKVTTVVMNGETEVSRTVTTNTVFEPNEVPSETSTTDPNTGYVTTVTTEVDNIQAKKGVWTNFFLSALGKNDSGGGGGGSTTLAGLLDVELTTPISNGQALIYNSTLGKWVNGAAGMSQADADLRYLKLAGGTLTGNLAIRGTYDLYQSDNGVSSIAYPGYRIYDINGNIASQYIGIVDPNGYNGFWIGARNYDTEGTMVADKGIGLAINKNGEGYWTVHEPASFRNAIGVYSSTETDSKYLPLTAGSTKALTGSLYLSSRSKGIFIPYTVSESSVNIPLIYDNSANLWIGSTETASTHHIGSTYISAGHNGTNGNETIYICVPNDANTNGTNYAVLHLGNYTTHLDSRYVTLSTAQTVTGVKTFTPQQIFTNGIKIGPYEIVADTENNGLHVKGGLYTDTFVSALGANSGGGGGGSSTLAGLNDVQLTLPISNGQALIYNSSLDMWVNGVAGMDQSTADARYLKLTGGTLTGNLTIKGTYNLYQSNNGVISIYYPGYRMYDTNGKLASQYIGIVNPNGYNGFWISACNYDANGTQIADKGIGLAINKNGEGYWTVHEPASFRNAIGVYSSTECDAKYLKLINSGIIDGHKVKLNGIDIEVPVAYKIPSPGSFVNGYWHKLGEYVTAGDSSCLVLTIYDGRGYNSEAEQNSIARIVIKDGWQSTRAAENSVGVTIERFGNYFDLQCLIVATAHNAGAVWIYFPWQYTAGTYMVSGQYTTWTHNIYTTDNPDTSDNDTTAEPVTNQTLDSTYAHSYLYLDNAYTNSNVASATKLQTARLIWGNSFNGTENVNGDINMEIGTYVKFKIGNDYTSALGVWGTGYDLLNIGYYTTLDKSYATNIYGNILRLYGSSSNLGILINTDGNVGVGTITPSYKLDVNGTINCTSIRIGGYTITADSSNGALRINSAGLYADTYISALGSNSGGGGGGVTLSEPLYSINNAGLGSPTGSGKTIVWNGTQWTYGTISSGTITSVGMTVPTGFSVSPSSIQSSGTFAITFSSGYSLPTNTKQSNWDTAYDMRHFHDNLNVLNGLTQTKMSNWDTAYDMRHSHNNLIVLNDITSTKVSHWDTAYGWGDHAIAGYSTPSSVATQLQTYAKIQNGTITIGDSSITPLTSDSGTFWGQSWQSGGTVSGNMSSVGNITTSSHGSNYIEGFRTIELYGDSSAGYGGYIDFHYNNSSSDYTSRIIENESGILSLLSPNVCGLMVGGYSGDYVQIGQVRLIYDYSNNAIKVEKSDGTAANLYATGGVSALGMSAGVSSIDAMTFGNLKVNNTLTFGNNYASIYMDDFLYIDSNSNISVNGVEFENSNAHISKLYLDSSRYIYVSSGKLYYYNGSIAKEIALV